MKIGRTIALACLSLLIGASTSIAQAPQVPSLHAVSLTRGHVVSRSNFGQIVGNASFSSHSAETTRMAAVRVQLRSFSKPAAPYVVQCFFTAKDSLKQRYFYDVVKTTSSKVFDQIDI